MKKKIVKLLLTAITMTALMGCSDAKEQKGIQPTVAESAAKTTGEENTESPSPSGAWPTAKNIEFVVPASAGGGTDVLARIFTNYLTKAYPKNNFVVNNDTTGSGTVAMENVYNAETDGSLLLYYNTGMNILYYTKGYDKNIFDDFKICGLIQYQSDPMALVVPADAPYNTVQELVEAAKAAPGSLMTGAANASTRIFNAGALQVAGDCQFKVVDTGSEADTVTALLGGHINFAFISPSTAKQYVENNDMKVLGSAGAQRGITFPDIPTIEEQGFKGVNIENWCFVLAPKDTDESIADEINKAMKDYAADDEVKASLANMNTKYDWLDRQSAIDKLKELDDTIGEVAKTLGY